MYWFLVILSWWHMMFRDFTLWMCDAIGSLVITLWEIVMFSLCNVTELIVSSVAVLPMFCVSEGRMMSPMKIN
jgi:hypothetical protein